MLNGKDLGRIQHWVNSLEQKEYESSKPSSLSRPRMTEVSYFACGRPPVTTAAELVRVADARWAVEDLSSWPKIASNGCIRKRMTRTEPAADLHEQVVCPSEMSCPKVLRWFLKKPCRELHLSGCERDWNLKCRVQLDVHALICRRTG